MTHLSRNEIDEALQDPDDEMPDDEQAPDTDDELPEVREDPVPEED